MIYHFTPFFRGDISEGINRSVEAVPDDAWVCIRDADTMFLTWRQQWQLEKITQDTDYSLISCMTNRCYPWYCLHDGKLSEDYDILHHVEIAKQLERDHWCEVVQAGNPDDEGLLYGQMMMFPKRVWAEAGKFSGHVDHDFTFSRRVKALGHKLGVARGVYLFHAFRPGVKSPWYQSNFQNVAALDPESA